MARLTAVAATTEVDAVNKLLSTIGEAPFADQAELDASDSDDVNTAVEALKQAMRDMCALPWKFNTEKEYKLTADDTIVWTADSEEIGVFTVPSNLLSFNVSLRSDQQGSKYTDAIIGVSQQYAPLGTLVFRDRATGRDGFPTADREFLYIDPIWLIPSFTSLPETAKRFVIAHAGRVWQEGMVGSEVLRAFTADDERLALRSLKRDQGQEDDHNIFTNADVSKHLGFRPRTQSGYTDLRGGSLGLL
jgi:hypothetical protein